MEVRPPEWSRSNTGKALPYKLEMPDIGVSLSAASGLPQEGQNARAVVFHVLVQHLAMMVDLGLATPTDEHQV